MGLLDSVLGQLAQGLGSGELSSLASRLGMSQGDVASKLAQLLPDVVDKLTPDGRCWVLRSFRRSLRQLKDMHFAAVSAVSWTCATSKPA